MEDILNREVKLGSLVYLGNDYWGNNFGLVLSNDKVFTLAGKERIIKEKVVLLNPDDCEEATEINHSLINAYREYTINMAKIAEIMHTLAPGDILSYDNRGAYIYIGYGELNIHANTVSHFNYQVKGHLAISVKEAYKHQLFTPDEMKITYNAAEPCSSSEKMQCALQYGNIDLDKALNKILAAWQYRQFEGGNNSIRRKMMPKVIGALANNFKFDTRLGHINLIRPLSEWAGEYTMPKGSFIVDVELVSHEWDI